MMPAIAFADPESAGEAQTLAVLVVYEDLETGLRASNTLDRSVRRLDPTLDAQIDFWRFDFFREPAFLKQLTMQTANVLFFSAHNLAHFPAAVDSWFRKWLSYRSGEPRALVVLVDDDAKNIPGAAKMMEELSAAARDAGVDVFLHGVEAEAEWESAVEEIHLRADAKTLLLQEVLQQAERVPYREWGINE